MFPETPPTLLKRISDLAKGDDAAVWLEFVELYAPPLRNFVRTVNRTLSDADVDDAVQDVFVRLTKVLRADGIDRGKGRFRDYLAATTRRILVDRYRADVARQAAFDRATDSIVSRTSLAEAEPGALVDAAWLVAARQAAIEHVLTRTAISAQSARLYRAVVLEQRTLKEAAAEAGVGYEAAKQVKSRLDRAVAALMRRY